MKVKELVKLLNEMNPECDVVVFTDGKLYPTLAVQILDSDDDTETVVEIGCGWAEIEQEADGDL